ncbi:MAG: mechanosensitive ion channel family protein, partial [Solirubrobacteraceae bacterium]
MTGLAILAAALVLQLALYTVARRISRALEPHWRERVWLAAVLISLGLWSAAIWSASEYDGTLMQVRGTAASTVQMAFEKPLFRLGEMPYTAVDILLLPALLAALWIGVGVLSRVIRTRVERVLGHPSGAWETAALLARYAFTFIGAIVIFQVWGIDLASFAIFASVVGVGIGFGLQNIASNFISGVLIGIERPIQPGDFVDVGEHRGTVQRIGARSTSILTQDRVTILVPNSYFLDR